MSGPTKQQRQRMGRIASGLCVKCGNKRESLSPLTCEACRAKLRVTHDRPHPWRKTFKREREL